MNLKEIEEIMILMTKHRISNCQVDGVVITKEIHEPAAEATKPEAEIDDDELLFYSAK